MTTPQLFAKAHGKPVSPGGIRCALCYGSCAAGSPVADILSDSFTDFARARRYALRRMHDDPSRREPRGSTPPLFVGAHGHGEAVHES